MTRASKYWVILTAIVIVVIGLAINGIAQWILKVFVTILLFAEISTTVVLAFVFFFGYRVNPFSVLLHSYSQTHGSTFNWVWLGWFGAIAFMGWTYLSFEVAGATRGGGPRAGQERAARHDRGRRRASASS